MVSEKLVWHVVKDSAAIIGVSQLAPHDLRRSCARLCRAAGGELEQIQFLLGHVSVQTIERYLGCTQRISSAVNDRIGIQPKPSVGSSGRGADDTLGSQPHNTGIRALSVKVVLPAAFQVGSRHPRELPSLAGDRIAHQVPRPRRYK